MGTSVSRVATLELSACAWERCPTSVQPCRKRNSVYLLVDDLKLIWLSVYCIYYNYVIHNSQLMMHACEGEKGLFVLLY